MRLTTFLLMLLCLEAGAQNNLPAVGLWREHLPYQGTIDVTASATTVYAATPSSLFSVDLATKEIQRFSKVSGLSETGVSTIRFDPLSNKLFIAYGNSNIDVLTTGGIVNIPDLKRTNISGDKNIYQIYPDGDRCYLATGLGVIVLDAKKYEIKESWFIGQGGSYLKVNGFSKTASFYYAATDSGLKRTPANTPNPADFTAWSNISGTQGLPPGACTAVVTVQNRPVALVHDSLFVDNGSSWSFLYANDLPIAKLNESNNRLVVSQRRPNGASQVLILNATGAVQTTLSQPGVISFPEGAIEIGTDHWVADLFGGLSHFTGTTVADVYKLNSPENTALGGLAVLNNVFYATAGSVNESWNYQYNRSGIFRLKEGSWKAYNQYSFPRLDSLMDFITVAADPRDGSFWAGSYGGGLLHVGTDDAIQIYKQNSTLEGAIGDPLSYRVSGLAFDASNNLWVSNYGSPHPLQVLQENGIWQSFSIPFLLAEGAVAQIVIDNAEQKWIVSPKGNGLILFNDNNTLNNIQDDKWRLYRYGAGQGNLPSNNVLSVAKDKSGFIWVGTEDGIGVIQCPESVFTQGCEAVLPVIKDGGFANYLFKGEAVSSIAVDGADRKWIATNTGAWLISPDGDKVLSHFTELNSPLLSNDVKSIAIDGSTGEVFFATAKGICSFRGTATEASETASSVLVFPNPVRPGFTGSIAIRGLPENAFVKITEAGGRLVYQTRSLGGQAIWNGKDYRGQRASTGIYLVLATDELKQEKVVAKIVFIGN